MNTENKMPTIVSGFLASIAVNVFVAMLFGLAWNSGPATMGLPTLNLWQAMALFFCLFLAVFWPLYVVVVAGVNMLRASAPQFTTGQVENRIDSDDERNT